MEFEKMREILDKEPDEAVDDLMEIVKERYGEVPYIVNFMKDMPELFVSRMIYENTIMREFRNMDPKTVELIGIAVASALRCEHCLKAHIRVGQRIGVSKEEMFDAILIASTISNAAVLAEGTRSLDSELNGIVEGMSCSGDDNCTICNINPDIPE
ncbi:carboxymuconolactone decarboxylase family protein [Methanolobus sp. ZRKC3]|uniref:carboxymuconolactone decarboxylase family protein n=1 Tax=Methanolobus sp. ZRKC3 TaxID=3125786 RepID=UPI0032527E7D